MPDCYYHQGNDVDSLLNERMPPRRVQASTRLPARVLR